MGLCWLSACASAPSTQEPVEEALLVEHIRFEGNLRFDKARLLSHMHLKEDSWVPLTPDAEFDEALLALDARRLEELYRSYGYFEAVVADIDVVVRQEDHQVDLTFSLIEGPPTLVEDLSFQWAPDAALPPEERRQVEAVASLQRQQAFDVASFNDSLGSLRLEMQRRGYPLAQVRGEAQVLESARQARVVFLMQPGPQAHVRKVLYQGLDGVPRYMVERETRFAHGELCTPGLLNQLEGAVKGMQVFRWVAASVIPPVEEGQVDVLIKVSEAQPQRIRLGGALAVGAVRWQEELQASYTHTNLFGHLTRLDMSLVAGWAQLPSLLDPDTDGPVVRFQPWLTKKGLVDDQLVWTLRPSFSVDILEGYQYYSPSNRVGVSRWLGGVVRADISHTTKFVDFFNADPRLDNAGTILGRDFRDPFLLSYLELQATAWFVDSFTETQNGVVLEATYDLAGGPFQGDYDFHKLEGGARLYWKPWERLQIAARAGAGIIVPYGDQPGAPVNFKFYLGGANSLRGWGSRRLSPQIFECEGGGTDCRGIPVGGLSMLQGSLELRLRAFGDVSLVGFVDMGDVQAEDLSYVPSQWNYAAGPGLRYNSPLGVFRLDVGFRLNEPGVYPDEPGWAAYFGVGETF